MRRNMILYGMLFVQINLLAQNEGVIGHWHNIDSPKASIHIDSAGFYSLFTEDSLLSLEKLRFTIHQDTGCSKPFEIDQFGSGRIQIGSNYLILSHYKQGKGINDHIDEVGLFYKTGTEPSMLDFSKEPKTIIAIPEGFIGEFYIAYHQENGSPFLLDAQGNANLKLDWSGILETQLVEDPFRFAKKNEQIHYDNSNQPLVLLHQGFADKIDPAIPFQSICVFSSGFNQSSREWLNQKLRKSIEGNVGCYVVDTYKNLLKLWH